MLDQKTDRMGFVIGAVIVGAAIIFIANGSIPTLFASVADSFEEASEKGTDVISQIIPFTNYEERALVDFTDYLNQPMSWQQGGIMGDGSSSINNFVMRSDYLEIPPGRYTLRASTDRGYDVRMTMSVYTDKIEEELYDEIQTNEQGKIVHNLLINGDGFVNSTKESSNVHEFVVPEDAKYVRLRVLFGSQELKGTVGNSNGWVKEELVPSREVPMMHFEISRFEEKEEGA